MSQNNNGVHNWFFTMQLYFGVKRTENWIGSFVHSYSMETNFEPAKRQRA